MTTDSKLADKSVLLIEDEDIITDVIREVVTPFVVSLDVAGDVHNALACMTKRDYDIVFLDMKMPKINVMKLFSYMRDVKPHLLYRTIIITDDAQSEHTQSVMKESGCPCLAKPFKIRELCAAIAAVT